MKTTGRKLLVAVVFMLGTLSNYANVGGISKSTKLVKVIFENVEKNHNLIVKDSQGIILHKENISKDGHLEKIFDFSSLKDGAYEIVVDKDFEILVKTFEVKGNQILFKNSTEKTIFKPVIKNKEDKVLISRINFDRSPLAVSIYYNNQVILEEVLKSEKSVINKAYKLDKNLKGTYKVIVSNKEKSSTKEFIF